MSAGDRVRRLRDAAVHVIRERGRWETIGGVRLVVADWEGIRIVYRTPFQRLRHIPDTRSYSNALAFAQAEPDLAYVLEIWTYPSVSTQVWTLVLQAQWSDSDADQRVVAFKEGGWEWPLIKRWLSLN